MAFQNVISLTANGTRKIVEVNDTQLSTINVTATDATATESGVTTGTFTITSTSAAPVGGLSIHYTLSGTATDGIDYTIDASPAVITTGNTSVDITVTPIDDADIEPNETVILTLSASPNYTIGLNSQATVTIISDDTSIPHLAWRLFVNANNGAPLIQISELELWLSGIKYDTTGENFYATTTLGTNLPSKAFDGIKLNAADNTWVSNNINTNQGIGVVSSSAFAVDEYRVHALNHLDGVTRAPRDFRLQYSDDVITNQAEFDAATWVDADVRTGETGWSVPEERIYTF